MAQPQPPGPSYPFAVVVHEEIERATALLETAFLQRAELKAARQCEGSCPNHPGVQVKPQPTIHQPMDQCVAQKRGSCETRPDDCIACQERQLDRAWSLLLATGMHHHIQHGHARWQHHTHRHHLPASQEDDQRHQHGEMALLKQVVMIDQVALVRKD